MNSHKTAEEIASLLCPRNSHGLVTCLDCLPIANALHSYLLQESKPLLEALTEIRDTNGHSRACGTGFENCLPCKINSTIFKFQKKHGGV